MSSFDLSSARAILAKYQPQQPSTPRKRGVPTTTAAVSTPRKGRYGNNNGATPKQTKNEQQQQLAFQKNSLFRTFIREADRRKKLINNNQTSENEQHQHEEESANTDWLMASFIIHCFLSSSSSSQSTDDSEKTKENSSSSTSTSSMITANDLLISSSWPLGSTHFSLSLVDFAEILSLAFDDDEKKRNGSSSSSSTSSSSSSSSPADLISLPWTLASQIVTPEEDTFCGMMNLITIPEEELFEEIKAQSLALTEVNSLFVFCDRNNNNNNNSSSSSVISVIIDLLEDDEGNRKAVLANMMMSNDGKGIISLDHIVDFDEIIGKAFHCQSSCLMKISRKSHQQQSERNSSRSSNNSMASLRGPLFREPMSSLASHFKVLINSSSSSTSSSSSLFKDLPLDFILSPSSCSTREFVALIMKSIKSIEQKDSTTIFYNDGNSSSSSSSNSLSIEFLEELLFAQKSTLHSHHHHRTENNIHHPQIFIEYDDARCFGDQRLFGVSSSSSSRTTTTTTWVELTRFERRPEPTLFFENETNPHRPRQWSAPLLVGNSNDNNDKTLPLLLQSFIKSFVIVCRTQEDLDWIENVNNKYAAKTTKNAKNPERKTTLTKVSVLEDPLQDMMLIGNSNHQNNNSTSSSVVLQNLSSLSLICDAINNVMMNMNDMTTNNAPSSPISPQDFISCTSSRRVSGFNNNNNNNINVALLSLISLSSSSLCSLETLGVLCENILLHLGLLETKIKVRCGHVVVDHEKEEAMKKKTSTGRRGMITFVEEPTTPASDNNNNNADIGYEERLRRKLAMMMDNSDSTFAIKKSEELKELLLFVCASSSSSSLLIHYRTNKNKNNSSSSKFPQGSPFGQSALLVGTKIVEKHKKVKIIIRNHDDDEDPEAARRRRRRGEVEEEKFRMEIQSYKERVFMFRDCNPSSSFSRSWCLSADHQLLNDDSINIQGVVMLEKIDDTADGGADEENDEDVGNKDDENDIHHQEKNEENGDDIIGNNNATAVAEKHTNSSKDQNKKSITGRRLPSFIPKRYQRIDIINPASTISNIPFAPIFSSTSSASASSSSLFTHQLLFTLSIAFSQIEVAVSPQELFSILLLQVNSQKSSSSNNNNRTKATIAPCRHIHTLQQVCQEFIQKGKAKLREKQIVPLGRVRSLVLNATNSQFIPGLIQSLFEGAPLASSSSSTGKDDEEDDERQHPTYTSLFSPTPLTSTKNICMVVLNMSSIILQDNDGKESGDDKEQEQKGQQQLTCCLIEGFDAEYEIVHVVDCTPMFDESTTDGIETKKRNQEKNKFGRRWMMTIDEFIQGGRGAYGGGDRKDLSFPVLVLERQ